MCLCVVGAKPLKKQVAAYEMGNANYSKRNKI